MKEHTINLQEYRTPKSRVFSGRQRGEDVRRKSKIDLVEPDYTKITIVVPSDIGSINPSFLEEFLFNVVRKLGKGGFNNKFKFDCQGRYQIDEDLSEAIDHILKKDNALNYAFA
ncbi:MAG: hypothetical protein K9J37_23570 [Saprospiraceae bacterium]|nr:hypothetical protein [Saprospiraceae bacterium]MCF8252906.1 hypothetical protein [Saprospiraceae bacterium]MCF8314446.1 hypothetical protein [Saprospiraceae bacterium]MCF8443332.1 hypothetical protein [Saprospiraceae bacterium]